MFTGIITDQGTVDELVLDRARDSAVLTLSVPHAADDLPDGGSLAVNGVCLTATAGRTAGPAAGHPAGHPAEPAAGGATRDHASTGAGTAEPGAPTTVRLDVMGETLRRTTTGSLEPGDTVNLERCLAPTDRLDGHIVQGHVDGVARLTEREDLGDWERLRFSIPAALAPYLAEKGSVAVDGVSLTVTAVSDAGAVEHWFEVGLIPTTLTVTTLGGLATGRAVNLEVDVMAKYAARLASFAVLTGGTSPGASDEAASTAAGSDTERVQA